MIKAFRKSLVPLFLLLLSGHFFVTASAHEGIVRYARQKMDQASAVLERNLHHHNLVPGFGSNDQKSRDKIYFEEKEEENPDFVLTKTYTCDRSFFTTFYSKAPWFCEYLLAKPLPIYTHWLLNSSRRYLILSVFRI